MYKRQLVLALALLALIRVGRDLFVITLEGCEILTSLGEFAFLHTLADVPVDEGTLRIHEIELVRERGPRFGDGGCVGKHATM